MIIAPYGTWVSAVTSDALTGRSIGLSALRQDGNALYWLESRPSEAGRSTLMRWTAAFGLEELTPAPFDVGTRVHEYGGGAYSVAQGRIVFSHKRDGAVWLIEPGSEPRQIAAVGACRYADFSWDIGRRRVLAIREDHRNCAPNAPVAAIIALELDPPDPSANEGMVLHQGPDFLAAPRLDPHGNHLAWIEWDHPDMPWDATRLVVAGLDGTGGIAAARQIAGGTRESIIQPEWQTDGALLFSSDRSGWWRLYRWHRDSGDIAVLSPDGVEIGGPAWNFGSCHFVSLPGGGIVCSVIMAGRRLAARVADGSIELLPLDAVGQSPVPFEDGLAAIITPRDAPPAIMLIRDDTPVSVLRSSGPAILAPEHVARGEAIEFPTADGVTAHAFFYPPTNPRFAAPPDTKPPLILLSHGGPTAMTSDSLSLAVQWWTSRGLAVVDVNYRGSTGYGRAYRDSLIGEWGVADVEDCIAAARFLAMTGRVDAARMAIRGGSAGGFTVLAALTRSDLFKAGASLYGIADLALLAQDTHKFESRYLDRLVGPLPDAAALYRDRSPLYQLDKLTAPIIFFQGLEDRVVPPNQAETMVQAMQARGLPVAYYTFPGEGHGFRRAETIRRVLELELDFYGKIFGFIPAGLTETAEFFTNSGDS
jgi:dipeptidyl aminopeptidase/acylaminoacyl peptidase